MKKTVVHPVTGKGDRTGVGLALSRLVFMVGKNKVLAAAVNIKCLTQVLQGHGRAFDMPTRPSRTPWALPRRLTRLGPFPKGEVHGMLFGGAHLYPGPGHHAFETAAAELAVPIGFGNPKIHVTIGGISVPLSTRDRITWMICGISWVALG